jgi:hypothetical protein
VVCPAGFIDSIPRSVATGNEIFNTCLQCGDPGSFTLDHGGTYTISVGNDTDPATGTYSFVISGP